MRSVNTNYFFRSIKNELVNLKSNRRLLNSGKAKNILLRKATLKTIAGSQKPYQILKVLVSKKGEILTLGAEMENLEQKNKDTYVTFIKVTKNNNRNSYEVLDPENNLPLATKKLLQNNI
ncbi:hypothetical protein ACFLZV_06970 [Candidatus Margulisiibacteriota bacterium]